MRMSAGILPVTVPPAVGMIFTQRQLMTCLILRVYLKTTYRGVLDLLAASPPLRQRMGLTDKLPHFYYVAEVQYPQPGCWLLSGW